MDYTITYQDVHGEILTDVGIHNLVEFLSHLEYNGYTVLAVVANIK